MEASFLKFEEKGQFVGPFLFLVFYFLPLPLNENAHIFLAIFSWVIANWLLTSVPLYITGLMGVALSVVFGVAEAKEALAPLADPLIMLFMGGFLIARAFEVSSLDRKISLSILNHRWVKGNLERTIFALIMITAFISMWVSNTATTAMMLPIVLGIMKGLDIKEPRAQSSLLLSVAYAASIGGIATPMGSPPNFIVLGMLQKFAGIKLSFFTWVWMTFPLMLVLLLICYFYTIRQFSKGADIDRMIPSLDEKFTWTRTDFFILGVFGLAVFLWFSPSFVTLFLGEDHPLSVMIEKRLEPGVVSIFLASLLFVFPLGKKEKILKFEDGMSIDWGSLLLFGTGLSLGQMLFKSGLAELGGNYVMGLFNFMPYVLFLGCVVAFGVFFSEVASNTAAANILLPLIIAAAQKVQINPTVPAMAVGLACSLAFMLPVGTPPNAIVYGTGLVSLKQMARYGLSLNIMSIILVTFIFYLMQFFL